MELIVIVAVVAFIVSRRGRRARLDRTAQPVAIDYGELGYVTDTRWSIARPLARVEARRLFWHPAFVFGIALTPVMILLAEDGESGQLNRLSMSIALALVPLGWMAIIAANLCTLRATRSGAAELMATLPAPGPPRTLAHLLAAVTALVVSAAAVLIALIELSARDDAAGTISVVEAATGVLIVTGGAVVGVVVARWLPHPMWGIAAVVVVVLLQARFLDPSTWPWSGDEANQARFLGFLAKPTSSLDPALELRVPGWHLVYLVALTVLVAAVALLRHGSSRPVMTVAVGAFVFAAVVGWVQTRPVTAAQADVMIQYLTHPQDHQTCEQHANVRYCEFPAFLSMMDSWRARTEAVLAMLPPDVAARPLQVIQRPPTITGNSNCQPIKYTESLPAAVRSRLSVDQAWAPDGQVHPPLLRDAFPCSDSGGGVHHLFTAVQVGAWAVGLPPAPSGDNERCFADGQARAVLALWLGAQATPGGFSTLQRVADEHGPRMSFAGWDNPPMWGVSWTQNELYAAVALARVPQDEARTALVKYWDELTDRSASVARIFERFGVKPPGGLDTDIDPIVRSSCA